MRRTLCAGFAALLLSGEMSFAQTPIDIYAYFQKALLHYSKTRGSATS